MPTTKENETAGAALDRLFEYRETNTHGIRVLGTVEKPLFVAKDVCEILAIVNHRDALNSLDSDEKGVALTDTLGGKQEMAVVTESGLYHLIFKSRKKEAKAFRRWVTEEVLPSIRKTGGYEMPVVDAGVLLDTSPLVILIRGEAKVGKSLLGRILGGGEEALVLEHGGRSVLDRKAELQTALRSGKRVICVDGVAADGRKLCWEEHWFGVLPLMKLKVLRKY